MNNYAMPNDQAPADNLPHTEAGDFARRLRLAMDSVKMPERGRQAWLSKLLKVSGPTAYGYYHGIHMPDEAKTILLATELKVIYEWLRFDQKGKSGAHVIKDANLSRYRIAEATGDDEALPIALLNASGSCGGGSINWDDDQREPLLKEPSWFRRYKVKPRDALAVWADGDSMADFIVDGDIVIFDSSKTTPRTGNIYLIEHPDGLRIKKLRREIDGTWILESNNPDKRKYPDERIDTDHSELLAIKGEFIYRQGG